MRVVPEPILERSQRPDPPINEPALDVLKRAELLPREERLIAELLLRGNASRRKIAELLAVEPGTLTRRAQSATMPAWSMNEMTAAGCSRRM